MGLNPKSPFIKEPETITLDDGEKIQISLITRKTYKYDGQGKVVEILGWNLSTYYHEYFSYTDKYVIQRIEYTAVGNSTPNILRDTIQLDEQGLVSRQRGLGDAYLLYNTDKQPVGTSYYPGKTHVYENGNLTQVLKNATWVQRNGQSVPVDYQLNHFSYNLSRPNLPVIYQFRGQLSQNLPTKEIWEMHQSSQFRDGPVYQKVCTYTYDKQGRVKRRVVNGKALYSGWLIEDDTYGVGVTDYEYECP